MRTTLALAAVLLTGLSMTACGSDGGTTATDPGGAAPAADVLVRTLAVVTVMDTGSPELCLGPIAESWPPQCSGPALAGWDWADHRGTYEKSGTTRWGSYVVTGRWDGSTFTYQSAVPGPVYDPIEVPRPTYPEPTEQHTDAALQRIADEVGADLPGALGASVVGPRVLVDVVYDDGSLQDRVDARYGEGVVIVSSALVDADE